MKTRLQVEDTIKQTIEYHPQIGPCEASAILLALDAARTYGYGNVMAWLATEWAMILRDIQEMPEKSAIRAVSNRGPYTLPKA